MNWSYKIRGGALQFVLFIGAIIAILLMAFVLISYSHSFFHKKTDLTISLVQEADLGLRYSFNDPLATDVSLDFKALNNTNISINIKKDFWGILEKRASTATHNKTVFKKTALVGNSYPDGVNALYLTDRQRPIILAGKARITGDASLPVQGARMGNIRGNSYFRKQLIYGRITTSGSELPKPSREVISQLDNMFKDNPFAKEQVVALKPNMEITNSFYEPTLVVQDRIVHLRDNRLIGNIVIKASQKIIVESSTALRDVLLIAPEIIIKDKVIGSFQAISSGKIKVGANCNLLYPSVLLVEAKSNQNIQQQSGMQASIAIGKNTSLKGMVIYMDDQKEQSRLPHIRIAEMATVLGQVYCMDNLELKGTVIGNVTTDGFIAIENGGIYQNHLYNGIINSMDLTDNYAGLLMEGEQHKKIMKWLY